MNRVLQTINETVEFLLIYEVKDHDNLTKFSDKVAALTFLHRIADHIRDLSVLRAILVKEGNGINVYQLNDPQMLEVLAERLLYGRIKVKRTPRSRQSSATGIGPEPPQYMTPQEVEQMEKTRRGERRVTLPRDDSSGTEGNPPKQVDVQGLGFNSEGNSKLLLPETETASPKIGETKATMIGKNVHKIQADIRRSSGQFDTVNQPICDSKGNLILIPKYVDLETGIAKPGTPSQTANPDAVSFSRRLIIDDKPVGRPLAKDRQEIIRFIEAYKQREKVLPDRIAIQRYDPNTGEPVVTELYKSEDFLPTH